MPIRGRGNHMKMSCRHVSSRGVLACCIVALQMANLHAGAVAASEHSATDQAESASRSGALLLIAAVKEQRLDTIHRLVKEGADVNSIAQGEGTALIAACRGGDLQIVSGLLRLGANVNRAARGDGNPLIAAAINGDVAVVQRLVDAGASVNAVVSTDETPLINASRAGRLEVLGYLIERGADVNLGVTADNGQWRSPLNQARDRVVRDYLVGKGAVR